MQRICLFVFLALAGNAASKRANLNEAVNADLAVESQAEVEEAAAVADPAYNGMSYWDAIKDKIERIAPALQNNDYTSQFIVKEDDRPWKTKKYKAELDQYENEWGAEVSKDIDRKVLEVENHFWTLHGTQSAVFRGPNGNKTGDYKIFHPRFLARRWTWRVVKTGDDDDQIRFTIQKRLYDDHCKWFGLFSCRPALKIYVGRRGDKSTLIYYGVGDDDLDEPEFKFYHSVEDYKRNKRNWVAKIEHEKTKSTSSGALEDEYKVKVKPGEDAGLILLATTCLDKIGDDAKQPVEAEQNEQYD